MRSAKKISIITACHNEQENIIELYERLVRVLSLLAPDFEIIYVDNASSDNSRQIYRDLCQKDRRVKVIIMSRNFNSSQYSFLAGLKYCTGDCAVIMDGDLQDPPEVIPKLFEKWQEGYEVAYGVRVRRRGNLFRRFCYKAFYRVFKKMAYVNIPLDAGDFSLIDRIIIDEIKKFEEKDLYLRGIRSYIGFSQIGVDYIRDSRNKGKAETSFFTDLKWAKNLIVNFSFKPLEWISKLAFIVVLTSLAGIATELVFFFTVQRPPGMPTIVMSILFFGGVQLLCLSVIGEYLAKIFQEVKNRPRYIIQEIINNNQDNIKQDT